MKGLLFCAMQLLDAGACLETRDGARLFAQVVMAPGTFVTREQVDGLAVVALSGLMAEADAYGKAFGAQEDFKLLNSLLLRCNPPLTAQQQQDIV